MEPVAIIPFVAVIDPLLTTNAALFMRSLPEILTVPLLVYKLIDDPVTVILLPTENMPVDRLAGELAFAPNLI